MTRRRHATPANRPYVPHHWTLTSLHRPLARGHAPVPRPTFAERTDARAAVDIVATPAAARRIVPESPGPSSNTLDASSGNSPPLRGTLVPAEEDDVFVPTDVRVLGRAIQIPRWQTWARAVQEKLAEMMEEAA